MKYPCLTLLMVCGTVIFFCASCAMSYYDPSVTAEAGTMNGGDALDINEFFDKFNIHVKPLDETTGGGEVATASIGGVSGGGDSTGGGEVATASIGGEASTGGEPSTGAQPSNRVSSTGDETSDSSPADSSPADSGTTGPAGSSPADSGTTGPAGSSPADSGTTNSGGPAPAVPDITLPAPGDVQDPYPSQYSSPQGAQNLSNEKMSWYFNRNRDHQPPTAQRVFDIRPYGGYYLGDITAPVVYLTFDEGYENGYTARILDVLRDKGVPAAFFLTKPYIRDNPGLAARMAEEGHTAANHSVTHRSFPGLTDEEIVYELTETARYFHEITGYDMPLFFRPPMGEYSERTLAAAHALGYATVFWSFAHQDWLVDDQPGRETTYKRVMDNIHNGAVLLLHAVSESNTQALPDIIDGLRALGYTFGTLDELGR